VLEFNAKYATDDATKRGISGEADFDIDKYRIFLRKRIDEKTSFTARLGSGKGHENGAAPTEWEQYYVTLKLGYDITLTAGRFPIDWEGDLGFYDDDDAWLGDFNRQGFKFQKDWGIANLQLILARNNDDGRIWTLDPETGSITQGSAYESFLIAALADFNFNEMFRGGVLGYYNLYEDASPNDSDYTLGVYAGFRFHPSVELKGIYYHQDGDDWVDNASAWKLILDVDQDLLKFTSLWLEYGQLKDGFQLTNEPYAFGEGHLNVKKISNAGTSDVTVYGARANQQWNEKWNTFERYWHAEFDDIRVNDGIDNFTFGVGYQYTPAVKFELAYDLLDGDGYYDDDGMIRFQTVVNF
jgi:hypothetical protein